jgi:predicted membrane protein
MQTKIVREISLASLFIALGLVLPLAFHAFGPGTTFLPMHIPVLIAGFVLSLPYAIGVAIITPILSSFLTGMPVLFPVLPFMIFELLAYAVVVNLLYRKFKLNVYVALVISMVAGRIASTLVVWVLVSFFMAKLPAPTVFIVTAVTAGIPGIIIQLVFIPTLILILQKTNLIKRSNLVKA